MPSTTIQPTGLPKQGTQTLVLTVGDWQMCEFATAKTRMADAADWRQAADIDEACRLVQQSELPPELIFLAQPFPGSYEQAEIDRLQQLAPLMRLVLVAGTWCEGELRTGSPPSGVIRLYWYELATWWQTATRQLEAGLCPPWSLPLDHPQAGRWLTEEACSPIVSQATTVLIDAADYAVYKTLAAAFKSYGLATVWKGRCEDESAEPSATAGIWDGGQLSSAELDRLSRFCQQVDGPVIALLDFPRIEHLERAQAAGAMQVFAKPYVVEELVAAFAIKTNVPSSGK